MNRLVHGIRRPTLKMARRINKALSVELSTSEIEIYLNIADARTRFEEGQPFDAEPDWGKLSSLRNYLRNGHGDKIKAILSTWPRERATGFIFAYALLERQWVVSRLLGVTQKKTHFDTVMALMDEYAIPWRKWLRPLAECRRAYMSDRFFLIVHRAIAEATSDPKVRLGIEKDIREAYYAMEDYRRGGVGYRKGRVGEIFPWDFDDLNDPVGSRMKAIARSKAWFKGAGKAVEHS